MREIVWLIDFSFFARIIWQPSNGKIYKEYNNYCTKRTITENNNNKVMTTRTKLIIDINKILIPHKRKMFGKREIHT